MKQDQIGKDPRISKPDLNCSFQKPNLQITVHFCPLVWNLRELNALQIQKTSSRLRHHDIP